MAESYLICAQQALSRTNESANDKGPRTARAFAVGKKSSYLCAVITGFSVAAGGFTL